MDGRHDHNLAAHRVRIADHIRGCRDDGCPFCEAEAEDRKWERDGI